MRKYWVPGVQHFVLKALWKSELGLVPFEVSLFLSLSSPDSGSPSRFLAAREAGAAMAWSCCSSEGDLCVVVSPINGNSRDRTEPPVCRRRLFGLVFDLHRCRYSTRTCP